MMFTKTIKQIVAVLLIAVALFGAQVVATEMGVPLTPQVHACGGSTSTGGGGC